MDDHEVEPNFDPPPPDTARRPEDVPPSEQGRTLFGGKEGGGRVTFGGEVEEQQTEQLAGQMMRSVQHQLQTASERVESIRWIETDGSKHIEDPNRLSVTQFELALSSGKRYILEGPVINLRIEN